MNSDLLIVDASVAMKWFIPEVHSADALRLQAPGWSLHVPAFFNIEMGNILCKKVRQGELATADAVDMVTRLPTLPLASHPALSLVVPAFDLACETGRTVYDCLYLALAIRLGGRLVTADRRLVNGLSSSSHAAHLCWVEDVP